MLRDDVLLLLTEAEGYVSGEEMREKLGVTRAAVSQAVRALRAAGYDIDAVTNRGYYLRARPDTLTAGDVLPYLPQARRALVQCFAQIDSTNSYLKAEAMAGAPDGLCAIADRQTAGNDEDGVARALWVQPQIIGEVDKAGRPRPGKAALEEVRIPADVIVVAIGQGVEIQGFDQAGVPIQRGAFVAGLSGQVRDMDSVFAGGDCVTGPATAIRAIAAGKVAAANIDEHLGFRHEITVDVEIPSPKLNNSPPHGRIDTTEREACERKHDFEDIECGLTQEGACAEAGRCLRCDHFGYGIFRGGRNEKW